MKITDSYLVKQNKYGSKYYGTLRIKGRPRAKAVSIELIQNKNLFITYTLFDDQGNLRAQFVNIKAPQPIYLSEDFHCSSRLTVPGPLTSSYWTMEILVMSRGGSLAENEMLFSLRTEWLDTLPLPQRELDIPWFSETSPYCLSRFPWGKEKFEETRWYRGDFHAHTFLSDGFLSLDRQIELAGENGLDFFNITDHNLFHNSAPETENLLLLSGIEVTSYLGHANMFFLKDSPFQANHLSDILEEDGMNKIFRTRDQDTLVSINHPFSSTHPWKFKKTELPLIDCIEIINNPYFKYSPFIADQAIEAWNVLLNDGYRTVGIAGSDSHFPPEFKDKIDLGFSLVGQPTTYVHCAGLSPKNIRDSVKQGHVVVSLGKPIQFEIGSYISGMDYPFEEGTARAKIQEENILIIEWVIDGIIVKRDRSPVSTYSFDENSRPKQWMRVDVRHEDGSLYGFTNPIFFSKKTTSLKTWEDMLERMDFREEDISIIS